ncbi:MAG: tetratricopeptide repeat protein [Salegentibacter sp.]
MKTNILTVSLSLLSLAAVAQKSEIKDAGDAIENGNYAEAKTDLTKAESMLSEANDKWQERFYFYKGQAYLGGGDNITAEDAQVAADAFQKAADMGNEEAKQGLNNLTTKLLNSAVADQGKKAFGQATDKLHTAYKLNTQDTIYLYYAANSALQGEDYDTALEYLNDLKKMDYDGSGMNYLATNVETGEQEKMPSKQQRELFIKSGQYKDPVDEKIPSKKGEIAGLIARIYIAQEDYDKAIAAMDAAKAENPDDISLLQAEADMYYRMGKKDKYKELMEKIVEKEPDNASLYYNLGVSSAELGNNDEAVKYYKKALELDPEMNDARMNIVVAILAKERALIDEMNGLGMSKEDNKRYDELMEQRKDIYREAIPYLEKVVENDPTNTDAVRTAMNMYGQLDKPEKVKEMKALLEKQQQ